MIPLEVFGSESVAADVFKQLQCDINVTCKTAHQCDEQLGSNVWVIVVDDDREFSEFVRVRTSLELVDDGIN